METILKVVTTAYVPSTFAGFMANGRQLSVPELTEHYNSETASISFDALLGAAEDFRVDISEVEDGADAAAVVATPPATTLAGEPTLKGLVETGMRDPEKHLRAMVDTIKAVSVKWDIESEVLSLRLGRQSKVDPFYLVGWDSAQPIQRWHSCGAYYLGHEFNQGHEHPEALWCQRRYSLKHIETLLSRLDKQ